MRKILILLAAVCLTGTATMAQTLNENSGWLFLMNTAKFNEKWGSHLDLQVRTHDEWDGVRNLLIRPGLTYYFNKNNDLTVGYLLNDTYSKAVGLADNRLTEHRIWQQYIHRHKLSSVMLSHRFRAEQRFIEHNGQDQLFSQRARYFIRMMLPLQKGEFTTGPFVALQNEVFLHLQNKNQLSGHTFDQNRAYAAVGYRISKGLDLEAGYLNQMSKGRVNNVVNNVVQLAVYSRF